MSSPGSLGHEASATADKISPRFVYPTLNLSRSEFRLLYLYPGQYEDGIKVHLKTFTLPALPFSFKDEAHFTQLSEVYDALSTALDQRIAFQSAQLLRWQRLHDELEELFRDRLLSRLESDGHFKSCPATYSFEIPKDDQGDAMRKLHGMRESFFILVEEYQRTTSHPFETAEFQNLIGCLTNHRRVFKIMPDYEAVSYFCGDQTITVPIVLNNTSVEVPATAAHALRGLRHKGEMRILWLDALCIDQCNDTERAHQVLQLAKIYACATRTLAWLGDEDETLTGSFSSCFESLQQSANPRPLVKPLPEGVELISRHQGTSIYHVPVSADAPSLDPSLVRTLDAATSAIVALLAKYLKRPWFSRLWMYQEVLLAQECVCCVGSYEIEWSWVQRAFRSTSKVPHKPSVVSESGFSAP